MNRDPDPLTKETMMDRIATFLRRSPLWCLAGALLWIPGCAGDQETAPPTTVAVAAEDAERATVELEPRFRLVGATGAVPEKVLVAFPQDVFPAARVDEEAGSATVLGFEPPVPGKLEVIGSSTLQFIPASGFAPGTRYEVELRSVETEESGVVTASGESAWKQTFSTPEFAFVRFSLIDVKARENEALVQLVFSGAVEADEVRRNARFTVVDESGETTRIPRVRFASGEEEHIVKAYLSNRGLSPGSRLELELDDGIPNAVDRERTARGTTGWIRFTDTPQLRIVDVYRAESDSGFYLQVICDDQALDERFGFWDDERGEWWEVSRRCIPTEAAAAEGIHFEPPVEFSVTPGRGGFRIFGDFERRRYALRLDAGLRTVDGGILPAVYETSFEIPARRSRVRFVSQGRYLPRSAWKLLPVRHLNVERASLAVRHVPAGNLVFWMSDERSEKATDRNSNLIRRQTVPLTGPPDQEATSYLDLGTLVPAATRGLLEVEVWGGGSSDTARLVLTDLHLVAKRSAAGVDAWALDMHSSEPVRGVEMRLVRKSGFVLASCRTGAKGRCRLEPSPDQLDPSPPFAIIANRDYDLTYLKFADLEAEVEEARVAGEPYRGGRNYRAALYSDRGVYRPGETAHLAAIVRQGDNLAPPAEMPVRGRLIDPRGKKTRSLNLHTNDAGYLSFDLAFPAFATTGRYEVELEVADRRVGRHHFQVEEFVPERMKVEVTSTEPHYLLRDEMSFAVAARYLFGGVPKDHRVELRCDLEPTDFEPAQNANFHYGVWRQGEGPERGVTLGTASGTLDDNGRTALSCPGGGRTGGFLGPARVLARAAVFESGSGRTTVGRAVVPVHPEEFYIGLASSAGEARAGQELRIDGVTVDWEGKLVTGIPEVEVQFVRLETEYGWYWDESSGRWSNRRHLRPVTEERTLVEVRDGKFRRSWTPSADAASFLVRARRGAARTDLEIAGRGEWYYRAPEESGERTPGPGRATWIALEAPEQARVGEKLTVRFEAPYRGRMLWTAETDELLASEWNDVAAGPVNWSFVPREFVPNLYLTAFLIKDPHLDSADAYLPERAFGVASVTVEPVEFTHRLRLRVPEEVRSSSQLDVELRFGRLAEPTYATVAAVDEGILSLTRFPSPDPFPAIFTRRALGIETFETVGWTLLVPPGGPTAATGGGEGAALGRVQPIKPVALWSGLVEVPRDGKVAVKFDLPQYRGALRVMAVSAGPKKMGRASAEVLVRDPLVVQTTLPRFLIRDDDVRVPVFVTNLSGTVREVEVKVSAATVAVPGFDELAAAPLPVEISGDARTMLHLADGGSDTAVFRLRARQPVGAAKLRVEVSSGELSSIDETEVPLLPAGPKSRRVERIELEAGTMDLRPYLEGWMPLSEKSTFWATTQPYGDVMDHLKQLVRYPYGCIEQTTSTTRPLLFLGNFLHTLDPELTRKGSLEQMAQSGIDRVLSMQTPAGGFAYWPGGSEPVHWGTAYAAHLLLDAQKLDYTVPQEAIDEALEWMERQITHHFERGAHGDDWYSRDAEPYLHFVLALGGRARKARIQKLVDELGPRPATGAEKEALYMLQAALHLAGDQRYEEHLRRPDLSAITDERDNGWTFYSDRRRRGFMLSTLVDLFGPDPGAEPLANLVAEGLRGNPSSWYTTQELVWSITGLGKYTAAGAVDFKPPILKAGQRRIEPREPAPGHGNERTWSLARASEYDELTIEVPEKKGDGKLYLILSSEGVRTQADARFGGEGLELGRDYLDASGKPVDLTGGDHRLGDLVYVRLTLHNLSPERIANIALVDRIPAGWEIENPRLGRGSSPEWVDPDDLWQVDHLDLRDDRIELFGHLDRSDGATVVYAVRAVTAGRFTIPPVEAEAMYDPRIWAREQGTTIAVTGPWEAGDQE
ncbi:MAG: hypothetical protein GY856_05935 [bacterium]|nr:hypothetical protein [bacterium]